MDENDPRMRIIEVAINMMAAYAMIAKFLVSLPLTINLPELRNTEDGDDARKALINAWRALGDLPMAEEPKIWLRQMILDWVTASTYLERTPEDWTLDIIEGQCLRIFVTGELVQEELE